MRLEVGKQYFLRNGERVTVLRRVDNPDYPFVVKTSAGEEQYTPEGHYQVFEESPQDIVGGAEIDEVPPPPPVTRKAMPIVYKIKCLARYCNEQTDAVLCPRCYSAVKLGKRLPGEPALAAKEPKVVELMGQGLIVTIREVDDTN